MAFVEPRIATILLIAILLDALIGDPAWLWRRIGHPVTWFGWLIGLIDRRLNRDDDPPPRRRRLGMLATAALVLVAAAAGWLIGAPLDGFVGGIVEAFIVSVFLAQRSLHDHVARVRRAFVGEGEGLERARAAVAAVVGRDPRSLDEAGVCRAAIETTAENLCDGVIAPAVWYLIAGLPGLLVYKAVNTADSMIGHRSDRYRAFGWAAARLDDLLNLVPARLTGLVAALAGGAPMQALRTMWRDAPKHRSPNAGWPEAAFAAALGLALAGPRVYASGVVADAWMNPDGRMEAEPADIDRALKLMVAVCALFAALVALISAL